MAKVDFNEQVSVTAMGFRKNLSAYPKRMEFRGVTYSFIDAGIRCLIKHGSVIAEVITVSDGAKDYFLKTDNCSNNWTLLGIAS